MNYYVIKNTRFLDKRFAYGEERSPNFGEAERCPRCGNFTSMSRWLPPYAINVSKKELGDFMYGTFVGFVVSERAKRVLEATGISGFKGFGDVSIYYKEELLSAHYYYSEIDLLNVHLDMNFLTLEIRELCEVCQRGNSLLQGIKGVRILDPDSVNSDVFFTTTLGQATIMVSEKFNAAVAANRLTNVQLIPAEQYEWHSMGRR